MKRSALAFLLTGTALAGGGAAPPADDLRALRVLRGPAFDRAWLDETRLQGGLLAGLDQLESRYGQRPALKSWAAADRLRRQATDERWQALGQPLQGFPAAASHDVVVGIANSTEKTFLAHFDAFFLAEYPKSASRLLTLARLDLSESVNPALRREALALLPTERAALDDLRRLK